MTSSSLTERHYLDLTVILEVDSFCKSLHGAYTGGLYSQKNSGVLDLTISEPNLVQLNSWFRSECFCQG